MLFADPAPPVLPPLPSPLTTAGADAPLLLTLSLAVERAVPACPPVLLRNDCLPTVA